MAIWDVYGHVSPDVSRNAVTTLGTVGSSSLVKERIASLAAVLLQVVAAGHPLAAISRRQEVTARCSVGRRPSSCGRSSWPSSSHPMP
jgi:hypothetical protein